MSLSVEPVEALLKPLVRDVINARGLRGQEPVEFFFFRKCSG